VTGSHITDVDLRLLRVMGALLETGGVSRAAEVLGVTSSAISHSLSALRRRTGDSLFVRSAGGFSPTPRALAMQPRLQRALVDLQTVLTAEADFDPSSSIQQFSLAATDFILERLPLAVESVRRVAPHVRMKLLGINGPLNGPLASGEIDLALTYGSAESFLKLDRETMRVAAGIDRFVCLLRSDHPALRNDVFDLKSYLALAHVCIASSGKTNSVVNDSLKSLGQERRIVLTVDDARAAVHCVANSDLIATVPKGYASNAVSAGQVVALAPPFELPTANIYLWWHERVHNEPSHIWWREMILKNLGRYSPDPPIVE
jgi:DNA-binding transcriptional LysR family regulator